MPKFHTYSRNKKEKEIKKIPIGRFLILALLFWLGFQFIPDKVKNLEKNESSKSSELKSSSSSKQITNRPVIKKASWKNDDKTSGVRIEFLRHKTEWNHLLDSTLISNKIREYTIFGYQNCMDSGRVKVRFLWGSELREWSYECDGKRTEFKRSSEGKWLRENGCLLTENCWGEITKAKNYKTLENPYGFSFKNPKSTTILSPQKARVVFASTQKLILHFGMDYNLEILGKLNWRKKFQVDERIRKGSEIAKVKANENWSYHFRRGENYIDFTELKNKSLGAFQKYSKIIVDSTLEK